MWEHSTARRAKCSSEFRAIHGERYSSQYVAMFPAGHAAASYDDIVAGSWSGGRHAAEMTLKKDGDENGNGQRKRRASRAATCASPIGFVSFEESAAPETTATPPDVRPPALNNELRRHDIALLVAVQRTKAARSWLKLKARIRRWYNRIDGMLCRIRVKDLCRPVWLL